MSLGRSFRFCPFVSNVKNETRGQIQKDRPHVLRRAAAHMRIGNAARRRYMSTVQYMKYLKPKGVLKKPLTLSSSMYRSV